MSALASRAFRRHPDMSVGVSPRLRSPELETTRQRTKLRKSRRVLPDCRSPRAAPEALWICRDVQSRYRTVLLPQPQRRILAQAGNDLSHHEVEPRGREEDMTDQGFGRRDFLKTTIAGGPPPPATPTAIPASSTQAQQPAAQPAAEGYEFLNLDEAAFVEALVDHMVPADELTPKGTEIGINIYIDRALSGAWGKGERLYMQGPWQVG